MRAVESGQWRACALATGHCFVAHSPIDVDRIVAPHLLKSSLACPASTKASPSEAGIKKLALPTGRGRPFNLWVGVQKDLEPGSVQESVGETHRAGAARRLRW